jgi:DmsE family decaheme c-type cytochrome
LDWKFVFFGGLALFCWALIGLVQSANAQETLTVAAINSTLRGLSQPPSPDKPPQAHQSADDEALSALSTFAQQIAAEKPHSVIGQASGQASQDTDRQFDDRAYSALQDFAQRIGTQTPQSIKGRTKLAEADNALDALRDFLSKNASPNTETPSTPPVAPKNTSAPVEATYVGAKVCMNCHASLADSFGHTLMGRIGKTQQGKFDCENCHGPGSAHAKAGGGRDVGGLISFRPNDQSHSVDETNSICLTCHQRGDRTNWSGSTHETRGLLCTNCHTIMKSVSAKFQLKTAIEPDTCFQCHKDRRAQMFSSAHMPVREGKMVCSDCHNPHGSVTESLLRANSINENCYKCHAEKRGPFLFEHSPVRENCVSCHNPHGSINEASLKMPRPRLCFECHSIGHAQSSGVNDIKTMSRACNNCHTQIHGTNSPAGFALQR